MRLVWLTFLLLFPILPCAQGQPVIAGPILHGATGDDIRVGLAGTSGFPVWVAAEYDGRSPEFPGVDQINVRLPDDGIVSPTRNFAALPQ